MSEHDIRALENHFALWKADRLPDADDGRAFERYAIEQVVKDAELSDAEIGSGHFGSKDDGGIDAMYFFVNRLLIEDETEVPERAITAELMIIQATMQKGFGEVAVERMHHFTQDLLDYSQPPQTLAAYNAVVRDAIGQFREKYDSIIGSLPSLTISFHYVSKADTPPNTKVNARVEKLKQFVGQQLSGAKVEFQFWDCKRLLEAARSFPSQDYTLRTTHLFVTGDEKAAVCLIQLKELATFLTDEHGNPRRGVLEPNVRAYQGKRNPVNKDIRTTLEQLDDKDFWWFNNGITLLADKYSFTGSLKLVVTRPQIVNGLQTCQEVFDHYKASPERVDTRNILVRVIIPPDEETRNRITKATNYQTEVNVLSLHALERVHIDIEERLKRFGLFYDRRKGEYRNQRKPITKIIGIQELARSVMSALLQLPDYARARPQTFLKDDAQYSQVFDTSYPKDLYVSATLIDRAVDAYLTNHADNLRYDVRRDLRNYMAMYVACALTKKAKPMPEDMANLRAKIQGSVDEPILEAAYTTTKQVYDQLGATDKAAKGSDMRGELLEIIKDRFSARAASSWASR